MSLNSFWFAYYYYYYYKNSRKSKNSTFQLSWSMHKIKVQWPQCSNSEMLPSRRPRFHVELRPILLLLLIVISLHNQHNVQIMKYAEISHSCFLICNTISRILHKCYCHTVNILSQKDLRRSARYFDTPVHSWRQCVGC